MRIKKVIGDDYIPSDYLKELGYNGMEIRTIKNIYVTGNWQDYFLDVIIIALQKNEKRKKGNTEKLA